MIDSVIFDCDGTLLDSMPAWHALQERFAQKAGIALNPMQLVRLNANTLPETAAFFHRECGLGSSVEEVLDDAHQILLSEYRDNVLAGGARPPAEWRRREARGCLVKPC